MEGRDPDRIRVLHVDDAPEFVEVTKTHLEREDDRIRVLTATNPTEGWSIIQEQDVDCVVSDYEMPGEDGIEFLETVRDDDPELPFILYTGKGSEELASEAIAAGVTDYLQKETGTDQYTVLANRIVNAVAKNRATRQLSAVENRYRALFAEMNEGVALHEPVYDDGEPVDYRLLEVNRRYETILNLDREAVVGRTATDVYGTDEPPYLDRYVEVIRTGESIEFETYYPPLEKHFHISAFSLNGTFATVFSDITERKRAEEKLRESRESYEHLFDSINDAVFVLDSTGEVVAVNETACERLGYDRDALRGMTPFDIDLDAPETTGKVEERMETVQQEGELTFETVHVTNSGEQIPVEVTARQIEYFGTDGVISVARDISDRKDRDRELETLNERFELALEAGQFGVWDWDIETDEVTYSDRWAAMLGYSIEAIEPDLSAWEDRVHPDDLPDAKTALKAHFRGETDYYDSDHRIETKSGDWIWVRDIGKVFERDDDGEPIRMVGIQQDITDRKERQTELQRQNERLAEFASVVSHDLRNPLQVAAGRLELATEDCDSEHLDRIGEAIDRSEALIDDLLTLARQGERVTETEAIDLPSAVEDCWRHVETAEATLSVETEQSIHADERRLQQVFENLFRNSVEHGGSDVTVTVGELADGFYVADDGPGIPQEDREDIFESGFSTVEAGTGFGLSIVEEIVQAHDWEITVTDSDAGGTRFEIGGVDLA